MKVIENKTSKIPVCICGDKFIATFTMGSGNQLISANAECSPCDKAYIATNDAKLTSIIQSDQNFIRNGIH